MELKPYKTVLDQSTKEYIVNKSRFLGACAPVASPEEALAFLAQEKAKYPDASHHCYAYVIGRNAGIMRYSDDGEPGGTAGMPIIEVMKARKVVDCAIVVTRYFGGVLLGAGGLTRAYSHSAALALDAAGVATMYPTQKHLCEVAYPLWDRVKHFLSAQPVKLSDESFMATVTFTLLVKQEDADAVLNGLLTVTDGTATTLWEDTLYSPWLDE